MIHREVEPAFTTSLLVRKNDHATPVIEEFESIEILLIGHDS